MQPISKSDFARQCNISRQYIGQAIKKNLLDICVHKNKEHIDLDGVNTQFFLSERAGGQKVQAAEPKKVSAKSKQNPSKTPSEPTTEPVQTKRLNTTIQPPKINNPSGNNGAPLGEEKKELEIDRLKETIEKLKIDNNKKRGDYIPKVLIVNFFNQLYAIDENQIKTLDVNIAPKISTMNNEANSEKTKKILELMDKKKDKELKKKINQILSSGEPERKKRLSEICEDATSKILKNIQREIDSALDNFERMAK